VGEIFELATFPSALGWMAMLGAGDVLWALTFGQPSPLAALRDLWQQDSGREQPRASGDADWNPKLVRRLQAYADGAIDDFRDVAIDTSGLSPFERRVVEHCRQIPFGETLTYGELAALAGSPRAARAVGNVMRTNRTPLVVPCHRVVASGGKIGQYSACGGQRTKLRLLESEATASGGDRS
jgi:methylated-DNA-[protein]-cysteine S-methyltransferase